MKRSYGFVIFLVFFSLIAGYLLSAISFIGRAGISLFYIKYQFLKSWWKDTLLVCIVWLALFFIQSFLYKKVSKKTSNTLQAIILMIAVAGMYFSYLDFRKTLSHRWLGERFHLGVYLFWLGWIAITIFCALQKQPLEDSVKIEDDKEFQAGKSEDSLL